MLLDTGRALDAFRGGHKDSGLNDLAAIANIAQFASFDPQLHQRFCRIHGEVPNAGYSSVEDCIAVLLRNSESGAVNIRSFRPGDSKGHPLIRGLRSVAAIAAAVRKQAGRGLFTIANEAIPTDDTGVSGVVLGDTLEFVPEDTPKAVESSGVASLPKRYGLKLLKSVYGFSPDVNLGGELRVEFSLHPIRRGLRREHTIIWEVERVFSEDASSIRVWPNRFSRFIGDKVYGLLIADILGFPVPRTTVVGRDVAPFSFGRETGTREIWFRTSPRVPVPGKYSTQLGWCDPFELMKEEDPDGNKIAAVIAQESVESVWSGAAQTGEKGTIIEGTPGYGDDFMLGRRRAESPPLEIRSAVKDVHDRLVETLDSVKFEWVWDGTSVWLVQVHKRAMGVSSSVIFSGNPRKYVRFDPDRGLDRLRTLISRVRGKDIGIVLTGDVGVTSHLGDVLREARVPSRVEVPHRS